MVYKYGGVLERKFIIFWLFRRDDYIYGFIYVRGVLDCNIFV